MHTTFYKIKCITNLHVGSGEVNYNIIDNEVEKDAVTGLPIIHASGVKGALRELGSRSLDKAVVERVFGARGEQELSNAGTHKFLDAHLIARTMRVGNSSAMASIPVVTVASVNRLLADLDAFGLKEKFGITEIEVPDFGDAKFLSNVPGISVEGEETAMLKGNTLNQLMLLKDIIGEKFAIAKSFDGYGLPVVARNHLDNGISKNLWYEEFVPHGSIFYFAVIAPKDGSDYKVPEDVQFGGHSSIGYGFTKVTVI